MAEAKRPADLYVGMSQKVGGSLQQRKTLYSSSIARFLRSDRCTRDCPCRRIGSNTRPTRRSDARCIYGKLKVHQFICFFPAQGGWLEEFHNTSPEILVGVNLRCAPTSKNYLMAYVRTKRHVHTRKNDKIPSVLGQEGSPRQ